MPAPEEIGGGMRRRIVEGLRDFTAELEADRSVPAGYVVLVVNANGGVNMKWAGTELSILGALEYAKHVITAKWRENREEEHR